MRRSVEWREVRERVEELLALARRDNEAHGVPIEKTEYYRGQIDAFKRVLALEEEKEAGE